ncbi:MAG: RluA family pseudouridine synthase [Lentisphaerae bacterium]|nr:RluA family pseudouridine synthase [Lentisphaerota bacterium]
MQLQVEQDEAGLRLDTWISRHVPQISRARAQALIHGNCVRLPDERRLSAHTRVTAGMRVEVTIPEPEPVALTPEEIPLDILFEDKDIVVLNKPAGLVVHPAAGHADGTLVNALLHHCPDLGGIGGELRPGIVHRLDMNTTGAMVAAKNDEAMDSLMRQFKDGSVVKEYSALVHGLPSPRNGTVKTLIGRHPTDRKRMSARPSAGRDAVTHYRVIRAWARVTLLDVRIETGRTHQIRVHMAHIRHPVVGDPDYGSRRMDREFGVKRQMLHARRLSLRHPRSGEAMTWVAPLPDDFAGLLAALGPDIPPIRAR